MEVNILFITMSLCYLCSCYREVVWSGDFQFYTGAYDNITAVQKYVSLPSNISGWYDIDMGFVELKYFLLYPTTNGVDLSNIAPMTLCQNIQLIPGRKYQIKYSLFCIPKLYKMTLRAFLNNVTISTLYVADNATFGNKIDYFYATDVSNQLCFNQIHSILPSFIGVANINQSGGIIDNVSILQAEVFQIEFNCTLYQQDSQIVLQSNFTFDQMIVDKIMSLYDLKAFNISFQRVQFAQDEENIFIVKITSNFSFPLSQLKFIQRIQPNPTQMTFYNLQINHQNEYFHAITITQKENIKGVQIVLEEILKVVISITNLLKVSFCSYFLLTLFSFQNLSLFYIFMNIEIIPLFTKQIYYQLLYILFVEMSLSNWLYRNINLPINLFSLQIETQNIPEVMPSLMDQQNWFGAYGFTSLFFNNNSENLMTLLFLMIKIMLVKFVMKFVSKQTKRKLNLQSHFVIVFIIEVVNMIPCFIVSAVHRILRSNQQYNESIQKIFHINISFVCLISIGVYYIQSNINQKTNVFFTKNKIKQNQIYQKKQEKKTQLELKNGKKENQQLNTKYENIGNKIKMIAKCKLIINKIKSQKINHIFFSSSENKQHQQQVKLQKSEKISGDEKIQNKNTSNKKEQLKKQNQVNKSFYPCKSKSIKRKMKFYNDIGDTLLNLTIPFLICFRLNLIYLGFNSIILSIKLILYFKTTQTKSKARRLLQFLINSTWLIHHIVFIIFYVIDCNKQKIDSNNNSIAAFVESLGLVAVFTVLIGYILEILKFLLKLVKIIISIFKFIVNWWKLKSAHEFLKSQLELNRMNQKYPKPEENQSPQQKIETYNRQNIGTHNRPRKIKSKVQINKVKFSKITNQTTDNKKLRTRQAY